MNKARSTAAALSGFRETLGGSAFIFLCRIAGAGLTLVSQVLLARWMGAESLGIYVIAFAWCQLLATLTNLGLPTAAVRFVGEGLAGGHNDRIRGFVRFAMRSTLLTSAVVAIAGAAAIYLLDVPASFRVALLFALLALPALARLQLMCGLANSFSRFTLGFLPTNLARPPLFLVLVGAAWLAGRELDPGAVMGLQFVAVFTVMLVTQWLIRSFLRSKLGEGSAAQQGAAWLRASMPMLATVLFSAYFAEIMIILIGLLLAPDEVARFHVGFRLALLINFGLFAIDTATAPDLARLYAAGDRRSVEALLTRATRLRVAGALLAIVAYAVAGRWALGWFGPEFVAGYPLLLILAVGQLVQAAVGPAARLLNISGHQDLTLMVSAGALLLAVGLVAALVPWYGVIGAAIAATLDMAAWALAMRVLLRRHTGLQVRVF